MILDHSLHDAWIEALTIGPRREICLALDLGSARISDPLLPDVATLRMGGIADFERVREFFACFERVPNSRIDRINVHRRAGQSFAVTLEIDPQGTIELVCSKFDLI